MRRVRERVEPHADADGTGRERLVAMAIAHELNLMEDLAYHHVVHQAVRGEVAGALKVRQRDALRAQNELRHVCTMAPACSVTRGIPAGRVDSSALSVHPVTATRTSCSRKWASSPSA
ncbi:hypothetical protein [Pseudonocardia humida]|uniref:Ferritin-like metal-binding protein YciE n=1 Tax=Pseudonocardia humida TaxID=2800819 RepID=A0ABT0ZZZ3_9PSEU|nr:hypothetical protein [Pseudonocardia humida]MCO1656306.1 hypothetical protein [Pseudonocardia humida]